MSKMHESFSFHFFKTLQTFFLKGFLAIFPLSVTFFALSFFYNSITKWLTPVQKLEPLWLQKVPGSELILVIALIFAIGILVKLLIIGPVIHYIELVISKIPFVNTLHSGLKSLVQFFEYEEKIGPEKQVVLVHFPQKPFYNIAFLLGPAPYYEKLIPQEKLKADEHYYRVFLPTSPVPGHGFFIVLPESEIITTDLSFEEALKITVSCGLIDPENNVTKL